MNLGCMKIQTRLFNQQFIDVMNNLKGGPDKVGVKSGLKSKTASAESDATRFNKKSMTDIADEEDARLLKQQTINQSNLDYQDLSRKVLLYCNQQRIVP